MPQFTSDDALRRRADEPGNDSRCVSPLRCWKDLPGAGPASQLHALLAQPSGAIERVERPRRAQRAVVIHQTPHRPARLASLREIFGNDPRQDLDEHAGHQGTGALRPETLGQPAAQLRNRERRAGRHASDFFGHEQRRRQQKSIAEALVGNDFGFELRPQFRGPVGRSRLHLALHDTADAGASLRGMKYVGGSRCDHAASLFADLQDKVATRAKWPMIWNKLLRQRAQRGCVTCTDVAHRASSALARDQTSGSFSRDASRRTGRHPAMCAGLLRCAPARASATRTRARRSAPAAS